MQQLGPLVGLPDNKTRNFDTPRSGAKSFCFDDSVKGGGRYKLDEGQGRDSSSSYFANQCLHST